MPSFPRKRESRFLKLFKFITDWMPAFAGMTNYDTVSQGGGNSFSISISIPSPLAGEGGVRENILNFSHLLFYEGGRFFALFIKLKNSLWGSSYAGSGLVIPERPFFVWR